MTLTTETYDELRQIAGRYPVARSGLLPMLHLVQSVEGCLTPAGIDACAEILGLTPAEVNGVATFYSMYKRRPVGTHHVGVCTNTLCAVLGGDLILERLQRHLGVGNDETTADGAITLEHVECNAACDYAPVVMVNWEFFDNQTPDSAVELVDRLRAGEPVTATRGAAITSWRDVERVLAGFEDGRVDEGPVAGEASLAGLRIARSAAVGEVAQPSVVEEVAQPSVVEEVAQPSVVEEVAQPSVVEEVAQQPSRNHPTAGAGPDGGFETVPSGTSSTTGDSGASSTTGDSGTSSTTEHDKLGAVHGADTQRAEAETVAETETDAGGKR